MVYHLLSEGVARRGRLARADSEADLCVSGERNGRARPVRIAKVRRIQDQGGRGSARAGHPSFFKRIRANGILWTKGELS